MTYPMAAETDLETFIAKTLKEWRNARGMSQSELAEKLGMHQSAIAKIENQDRKVDFSTVTRIADVLDIPWDELKFGEPTNGNELRSPLESYLVSVGKLEQEIASVHTAVRTHNQAARQLMKRLKIAGENGGIPDDFEARSLLSDMQRLQELADEVAPREEVRQAISRNVDSLRHLRAVLAGEPDACERAFQLANNRYWDNDYDDGQEDDE